MNKITKFINYINENYLGTIFTNYSFKDLTTLKIGGHIQCLYKPSSLDDLFIAFSYIFKNQIPYLVIGNGSNILATDKPISKIVINLSELNKITQISEEIFIVGSGIKTSLLSFELAKNNYTGCEFLSIIPGTLGGAIYMNAGVYQNSMEDIICDVTYLSTDGKLKTISKEEIDFKYRYSIFQNLKGIIVYATIKLKKSNINNAPLEKIATLKKKKRLTQPINTFSAGSTFKNPKNKKAWEIIDQLGYRGYRYNDIMVSNNHANYLINLKSATYQDAIYLINKIQKDALEKLNINLECEWEIIE